MYRIRKIKCDEGRPGCRRCVSTGRVCDGYGTGGIWGEGNAKRQRPIRPILDQRRLIPRGDMTTCEQSCFEWFTYRCTTKLPGIFASMFWNELVVQASLNEPAILHAAVALSSVHKKEIRRMKTQERLKPLDEEDKFIMTQYSKAIKHLQPHFLSKNKRSARVTLIACVVFTCLEFLRGHYKCGIVHFESGKKVLQELQIDLGSPGTQSSLLPSPNRDPADTWIVEAFLRLRVQVTLFEQGSQSLSDSLANCHLGPSDFAFESVNQARNDLDRLLIEIAQLTSQFHQEVSPNEINCPKELLDDKKRIRVSLENWMIAHDKFKATRQTGMKLYDTMACQLMDAYHTVACIMVECCVWPASSSIFDSYTDQFISVITRSIDMWKTAESSLVQKTSGFPTDISRSMVDMGWIGPLYYTILKCRIRRIRIQAIRLLRTDLHKEGIWDAALAACVGRKVMDIEEGDLYQDVSPEDEFSLETIPENSDLLLPALPYSYRLNNVRVVLPDDPFGKLMLICKRRLEDGSWEVIETYYDLGTRRWTNA